MLFKHESVYDFLHSQCLSHRIDGHIWEKSFEISLNETTHDSGSVIFSVHAEMCSFSNYFPFLKEKEEHAFEIDMHSACLSVAVFQCDGPLRHRLKS